MILTKDLLDTNMRGARMFLVTQAPFFGALLYGTEININIEEDAPACAWTDGDEIFFNIPKMQVALDETLKEKKHKNKTDEKTVFEVLMFITIHELMHCMFIHLQRRGSRDPLLWNVATDITINTLILSWFPKIHPPLKLLDNSQISYANKNAGAEVIYEELLSKAVVIKLCTGEDGDGQEGEGTMECDGKSTGFTVDILKDPKKNDGEIENKWRNRIEEAKLNCDGEMTPKTAGSGSTSVEELLDELYAPKVDWRALVDNLGGELSKGDYSFMRRAKSSIAFDWYLPSLRSYEPRVLVAIDVSGSVSKEEYKRFMSEIGGLLAMHNCKIDVLQCDTEIKSYVELEPGDEAPRLRCGYGGTYFKPVFEYARDRISNTIDAMLFFTDGYNGDKGFEKEFNPEYPVIWVMTTDHPPPSLGNSRSIRYDPYN
jgi:predicted metal-dependent peptidase